MDKEIKLKIGGIGVSVKGDGSYKVDRWHPFYKKFFSDCKPSINIGVYCGDIPKYHSSRMLFDARKEGFWKLFQNDCGYIMEFFDVSTYKKNKVCFLSGDFLRAELFIDSGLNSFYRRQMKKVPFWSCAYLMEPLTIIMLINILAEHNGIMVHGLGVSDQGRGIAFLGASGSGKSTLAGLYKQEGRAEILSDEHIIIKKENHKFFLYGTPWAGDSMGVCAKKVLLEKVFFIEHALENEVADIIDMGRFFSLCFLPFWNKIKVDSSLKLCMEIMQRAECKKLGFLNNPGVIDFVRASFKK